MQESLCRVVSRFKRVLTSPELALALFAVLTLATIPGTLTEHRGSYRSIPFIALLATLGISTCICTITRRRSISAPVILTHGGVVLVLCGALVGTGGFVGTVNVYEGATAQHFYRPDLGQDLPLGLELAVRKIRSETYPVPVQVGVLKGGVKHRLHSLSTGHSFELDGHTVHLDSLDLAQKVLHLSVKTSDGVIGSIDTSQPGKGVLAGFPYQFRLVAYRNPVVKRVWSDLVLTREGREVAGGSASVNHPLQWEQLSFYNTQVATDAVGRNYAGIQIVHDPGRPIVFAGLAVLAIGAVLLVLRRFYDGS